MSNPFEQDVLAQEGDNPFSADAFGSTIDDSELSVINAVNDETQQTPSFFGLTKIPDSLSKGFDSSIITSFRAMAAGQALQLSNEIPELLPYRQQQPDETDINFTQREAARDYLSGLSASLKSASDKLYLANQRDFERVGFSRPPESVPGFFYDVGQAFGSILPTLGMVAITRNPSLATAYTFAQQESATYKESIDAGRSHEEAMRNAFRTGAGVSAVELVGGKFYLSALQESPFVKRVIARALGQGAEEGAQSLIEDVSLSDIRMKDWEQIWNDAAYSFMVGSVAGAPLTTITTAVEDKLRAANVPEPAIKKGVERLVKNKAMLDEASVRIVANEAEGLTNDAPAKQAAIDAIASAGKKAEQVPLDVSRSQFATINQPKIQSEPFQAQLRAPLIDNSGVDIVTTDQLNNYIQEKHGVEIAVQERGDDLYVAAIKTPEDMRGQGAATAAMNDVKQYADSVGKRITLTPTSDFGANVKRLGDFYTKLGFTENKGANKDASIPDTFYRQPETVKVAPPSQEKRDFYQGFLQKSEPPPAGEWTKDVSSAISKALTPISTRLKSINPKFETRLRKFEQQKNLRINEAQKSALPFLEAFSRLNDPDKIILDAAMKNGDVEIINEVADKNGIDLQPLRTMLDKLYRDAEAVGLDIGYRENFFPRVVTRPKQLLAYFEKTEAWNDIEQAIKKKESELGTLLSNEEKAQMINTLLRGYKTSQITLARPGALKERSIDRITPEINQFYDTSDQALLKYITKVSEAVEARRFFGKGETMDDSIGAYVLRELDAGTITPAQAQELSDILKARFVDKPMNALLKAYKNLSYIDTMGSPISAITQIGDLGYAMANNGFFNTLSTLPQAISGKTEITLEDIGVAGIAQEFMDAGKTGNAVRKVFKFVGLEKMDSIGKVTYVNSALNRFREAAKNPTKQFSQSLEYMFEGEATQVMSDLQNGVNSENVKLLVFNELLNVQPVALSEMPEMYLKHPNGRIFYMLKTFTLKQYDIYRRQVFQQIREGRTAEGLKNLTRIAFFFTLMNAGSDFIKAMILDLDSEPEDVVFVNIARLAGIGKYHVYTVKREGVGTAAFKTIAPPFKAIDAISKDMTRAIDDGEVDINDMETVQSVPVAGKMYYWWFGAGSEK